MYSEARLPTQFSLITKQKWELGNHLFLKKREEILKGVLSELVILWEDHSQKDYLGEVFKLMKDWKVRLFTSEHKAAAAS